ncbi:hypothetical protein [Lentzea sp. NPDC055074]
MRDALLTLPAGRPDRTDGPPRLTADGLAATLLNCAETRPQPVVHSLPDLGGAR